MRGPDGLVEVQPPIPLPPYTVPAPGGFSDTGREGVDRGKASAGVGPGDTSIHGIPRLFSKRGVYFGGGGGTVGGAALLGG